MKKSIFTRIISVMLICMMMIGSMALGISAEETATTTPTVEIVSNNVKYGDTLKLMYAVKTTGMTDSQTLQVVLCDADGNVIGGTVRDTEDASVDGETLPAFVSKSGVPAQDIDQVIYAKAQILDGETVVAESDLQAYSVLEYLMDRLYMCESTEDQKAMYNALLTYAKAADTVLNGDSSIADAEYTPLTIAEALAADDGKNVILSGTVISVDEAWSDSFGNITVTIATSAADTTATIKLYRMATKVEKGDIITVKGTLGTYGGNKQVVAGAVAVITGSEEVAGPVEMSIADALAATDGTAVIVTGTVKQINTAWSDSYGNISVTIVDENGDELYIYKLATNVALYDVITVEGSMGSFNGARQIAAGATAEVIGKHESCEGYYADADCLNPATCIVCGATTGEANGHSYVDGTCSECGAAEGVTLKSSTLALIATTGALASDSSSIAWTDGIVTFTNLKSASTSAIRTSDSDHFRCYANSAVNISANGNKITKIEITCTSSGSYANVWSDSIGTSDANVTVTVDGKVVTITFAEGVTAFDVAKLTAQTRVNSITVTYEG